MPWSDHANRVGPGLEGIIGRKAGTAPGFSYSSAMKQSGIVWDAKTLDTYLESPQKAVPGNRMTYTGLKNPTDRTDLVNYLATLNSNSLSEASARRHPSDVTSLRWQY